MAIANQMQVIDVANKCEVRVAAIDTRQDHACAPSERNQLLSGGLGDADAVNRRDLWLAPKGFCKKRSDRATFGRQA